MVCLTEAVLIRFGKFKNCSLKFQPGLHVLYGENETGKSTLQLFLKVMFFGAATRKKADEMLKERERMIPWGEKNAEGILRLHVDDRDLEIRRRFGKTAAADKTEIFDLHTGEVPAGFTADSIGEKLFGVNVSVFEKTFWIRQDGVLFAGKDEELNRRLMNLCSSGDEEISAEHTIVLLEKQKRMIKAKDKRSTPGKLDDLYAEKDNLLLKLKQIQNDTDKREAAEKELKAAQDRLCEIEKEMEELTLESKAQERLKNLEIRLQKWKQAEILQQRETEAKSREEYEKFVGLEEQMVLQAEEQERRIKTLDQNVQIGYDKDKAEKTAAEERGKLWIGLFFMAVGFIVFALAVVLAILQHLAAAGGTVVISIMFAWIGVWWYFRCKQHNLDAMRKYYACEAEMDKMRREKEECGVRLENILRPYGCGSASELRCGMEKCRKAILEAESFHNARCTLLEMEDEEALRKDAEEAKALLKNDSSLLRKNIAGRIEQLQQSKTDMVVNISDLKTKIDFAFQNQQRPADIESCLRFLDEDIAEQKKLLRAVEMAQEVFTDTVCRRKSDFTPQINAKVNQYLDILTVGKYHETRVSEEYRIQISPQNTGLYSSEYFSFGTRQQLYLALRLALGSLIGQGNEPLFLDDFLIAYDDARAEAAITLLKQISLKRQIILFTCHNRDVEYAAKAGAAISHLEEEIVNVC